MRRFVKETRIAAPPAMVFGFHESPLALTSLIPPWESMRVAESSGSLHPGSRVVLKGRVAGIIPVRWVAVHAPPHLFADRQESGPFAMWEHRHEFLDDGEGGTILRDEVDYALPLGALGQWVAGGFVTRQIARMFAYRHETTKRIVESGR
jgi:ligand-binding SRPBCC domain-containing protein